MQISAIGIGLAKNVFQVHGVDAAEKLVLRDASLQPGSSWSRDRILRLCRNAPNHA